MKSDYLEALHKQLSESITRAQDLAGSLTHDAVNWAPEEGKWSIAQCLDHLLITADEYIEKMEPVIKKNQGTGVISNIDKTPRHTIMGRIIMMVVEPKAKIRVPAPKSFKPAQSNIPEDILERFLATHSKFAELMLECDGFPLDKIRMTSPDSPLIKLNLADAFEIVTIHTERHLNQAERVKTSEGFPT